MIGPVDLANVPAADPYAVIAEQVANCACWADLAREAASIRDNALLLYATRKAAACGRAFVGAVRECIVENPRAIK